MRIPATPPRIVFDTIEQVEAHTWAGDFHNDSPAFSAVNRFLLDVVDRDVARRAFRVVSENAMGEPYAVQSDADVDEELAEIRENESSLKQHRGY